MTKAWELLKEGVCILSQVYGALWFIHARTISLTTPTGFMEAVSSEGVEFTLVMLKEGVSSAIGGAVLGAKTAGLSLSMDYSFNTTVLFHYKPYNIL